MADVDNVTATLVRSIKVNSETYVTGTETITGGIATIYDVTLGTAGSNTLALTFDKTKVVAVYILADKALTSITFTGTTGPIASGAVAAGVPWEWSESLKAGTTYWGANCTDITIVTTAVDTTIKVRIVQEV